MAKTLQFRRGTTSELSSVTGAVGELFVDTTKDTVVVMDGSTAGGKPLATEAFVGTAVSNLIDSAPGALDTLNELAAALNDDANLASTITTALTAKQNTLTVLVGAQSYNSETSTLTVPGRTSHLTNDAGFVTSSELNTAGGYANSAFSKANTALIHAQAAYNAANTSGGGGSADFSSIAEDVLPQFSEVYDIGSTDRRWYDVYVGNNVDINGSQLTATDNVITTTSDFVAGSLLADDILISDNMITPDDTTARQYLGDKGVVVVNGNLDVQGDWIKAAKVQTTTTTAIVAADIPVGVTTMRVDDRGDRYEVKIDPSELTANQLKDLVRGVGGFPESGINLTYYPTPYTSEEFTNASGPYDTARVYKTSGTYMTFDRGTLDYNAGSPWNLFRAKIATLKAGDPVYFNNDTGGFGYGLVTSVSNLMDVVTVIFDESVFYTNIDHAGLLTLVKFPVRGETLTTPTGFKLLSAIPPGFGPTYVFVSGNLITFNLSKADAGTQYEIINGNLLPEDEVVYWNYPTTRIITPAESLISYVGETVGTTTVAPLTTGEAGLIRYNADNTNNDQLELHNGTAWIPVSLGDNVVYSRVISEEEAPITNTVDIEIPSDDGRYELQINNYGVYQADPNTLYRQWRMELITTCEDGSVMDWKGTRIQLGQSSGDTSALPDDAIMFFESEAFDANYRYNLSLDINIVGNCGTISSEFITFDYNYGPGFLSFKTIYAATNMGEATISRPKTIRLRGNFSGGNRKFAAGTEFKLIKK